MSLENFKNAVEIFVLPRLQLISASADGTRCGSGAKKPDFVMRLSRQINQLFLEDALDAVVAGVNGADFIELTSRFDDSTDGIVDDGRWAARLCDDQVFGHGDRDVNE